MNALRRPDWRFAPEPPPVWRPPPPRLRRAQAVAAVALSIALGVALGEPILRGVAFVWAVAHVLLGGAP